jgi:hypothetical protein
MNPLPHYDILLLVLDALQTRRQGPDLGLDGRDLARIFHVEHSVDVEAAGRAKSEVFSLGSASDLTRPGIRCGRSPNDLGTDAAHLVAETIRIPPVFRRCERVGSR